MTKMKTILLIAILLTSYCASAEAAWVFTQKETAGSGKTMNTTMTFGKNAIRTDIPDAQTSSLMNFAADKMYLLHHGQKMYMEMVISTMKAQLQQMLARAGQNKDKSTLTVKETGERKKIAGFESEKLVIMNGGKPSGEIWITKEIKDKDVFDVYRRFFELTGSQGAKPGEDLIAGLQKAITLGFPMKISIKTNSGDAVEQEVTSVTQKEVKAEAFLPPKDYKKMVMPGMPGGPGNPGQAPAPR